MGHLTSMKLFHHSAGSVDLQRQSCIRIVEEGRSFSFFGDSLVTVFSCHFACASQEHSREVELEGNRNGVEIYSSDGLLEDRNVETRLHWLYRATCYSKSTNTPWSYAESDVKAERLVGMNVKHSHHFWSPNFVDQQSSSRNCSKAFGIRYSSQRWICELWWLWQECGSCTFTKELLLDNLGTESHMKYSEAPAALDFWLNDCL